ncbi:dephospho-CoA kinase [Geobacter sp. DSM 9736]|uniref:dephospho-CoA kinase n=1 Tax=Geobacter sp. DSM 9736 TaxID=1277350 RepID=UPI000B50FEA3|nr:dephospho-CoA kinase [Geobacter sp. DSM 9736]SNB48005.1 dephospho-CoA kinase [Geobacter sp. DSM 9736]
MRIIGLTGGIASGKSTVARIFEQLGAVVIDADQLSREAVMPGRPAYDAIVAEFGPTVLCADGTIDRKALGCVVFADAAARSRLEKITHPAIRQLAEEKLAELREVPVPLVIYMAPLLIEAGAASRVDEIWVVFVDRETQITRLMARDGITREEALLRVGAQMPMEEKRTYGKAVIDNSGTREETELQVRRLWEREVAMEK